jgi:hypothetical protein
VTPPGLLSLVVLMLAIVGVFVFIPFVSNYAFWFAIAAFVILHWGTAAGANVSGIVSLILLGLAVAGCFADIPFVSNYAFWFVIAAYLIRLLAAIPRQTPDRFPLVHVG